MLTTTIPYKCQRPVSGSQMVAPLVAQNVTAQPGLFNYWNWMCWTLLKFLNKYSCGGNCDNDLVIKIGTSIKSDSVQYRGPSIHTDKMDTCGLNYTVRQIELDQEVTCSFCLNCEFEGKCKFFLSGNCLWSVQENSQHRWKSDSNDLSLLALVSSQ